MQSLFGQMQSQMCSSAQLYSTITFCLLDFQRPQCYTVAVRIALFRLGFLTCRFSDGSRISGFFVDLTIQ